MIGWPTRTNTAAMHSAAISARPADRPSRPSIRLNALVTPTSHRTESGAAQTPRWIATSNRCTTSPSDDAARDRNRRSRHVHQKLVPGAHASHVVEHRDDQDRQAADDEARRQLVRQRRHRTAMLTTAQTAAIAPTTARPPSRGIGTACVLRRPGMSMAPTSTARRAVSGVSANASAAAASRGQDEPDRSCSRRSPADRPSGATRQAGPRARRRLRAARGSVRPRRAG